MPRRFNAVAFRRLTGSQFSEFLFTKKGTDVLPQTRQANSVAVTMQSQVKMYTKQVTSRIYR